MAGLRARARPIFRTLKRTWANGGTIRTRGGARGADNTPQEHWGRAIFGGRKNGLNTGWPWG